MGREEGADKEGGWGNGQLGGRAVGGAGVDGERAGKGGGGVVYDEVATYRILEQSKFSHQPTWTTFERLLQL